MTSNERLVARSVVCTRLRLRCVSAPAGTRQAWAVLRKRLYIALVVAAPASVRAFAVGMLEVPPAGSVARQVGELSGPSGCSASRDVVSDVRLPSMRRHAGRAGHWRGERGPHLVVWLGGAASAGCVLPLPRFAERDRAYHSARFGLLAGMLRKQLLDFSHLQRNPGRELGQA